MRPRKWKILAPGSAGFRGIGPGTPPDPRHGGPWSGARAGSNRSSAPDANSGGAAIGCTLSLALRRGARRGASPRPSRKPRRRPRTPASGSIALPRQFRTSPRARYEASFYGIRPGEAIRYAIASEVKAVPIITAIGGEDGYRGPQSSRDVQSGRRLRHAVLCRLLWSGGRSRRRPRPVREALQLMWGRRDERVRSWMTNSNIMSVIGLTNSGSKAAVRMASIWNSGRPRNSEFLAKQKKELNGVTKPQREAPGEE